MKSGGEQDFWSRRKAAVQAETEAEAIHARSGQEARNALEQAEKQAEKTDIEILEELGLPEPESLTKGDDFSAFLSKAVPEHLRRRALRRLWASDPVLANLDGLLDYGDDFTGNGITAGALNTAYQVGRGLVSRLSDNGEAPAPSVPAPSVADAVLVEAEQSATEDETSQATAAPVEMIDSEPELLARRPRRMVFTFSQEAFE